VLVLASALLFVLLFAHALLTYRRGGDPLAGEVSLLFGAFTGIFLIGLANAVTPNDEAASIVQAVAAALILFVPLATLRLVSRFRELPRWVVPTAVGLYVAVAVPVVVMIDPEDPLPGWVTWLAIAGFVVTESAAAYFFLAESRDRVGAARLRLGTAATATALFAAALLVTQVDALGQAPQVLALLSAVGYVAAFMPPRRVLSATTMAAAHRYGRRLLTGSEQPTPQEVWRRFAAAVRDLTESDAVVVLAPTSNGKTAALAGAGLELNGQLLKHPVDFERLNRLSRQRRINPDCPVETALGHSVDARYATVVPLPPPYTGMSHHAAMLLSRHRSLFSGDDLEVIRDLGAHAALLGGRAEAAYEQRRLTGKLAEAVQALGVASRAKSDLLARVSHEFRTPLTAIIGYSALLQRSQQGGDPMLAHTAPDRIHRAGLRLLEMVEEVLDLAQMDAGHVTLQVEDVDLADLVRRTVDEMRPVAERKPVTLRSEVAPGSVPVDPKRMRQVLYNLLSNAIRFTPAGGTVSVVAEMDGDKVRIGVVDDGIGIPFDDQPRIFEEFTQVAEHGPHEGTGLGLSIVRRLVAAHGGHTELESAPGEGSRFIVTLPCRPENRPPPGDPVSGSAPEPGGRVGGQ
jgi:signal transduction histidine kinase